MKNLIFAVLCLALSCVPSFAQSSVLLSIVNPSATPIVVGTPFTLDVEVSGFSSQKIDSFDLNFVLPSGLTINSINTAMGLTAAPNFSGKESTSRPYEFSGFANAADGSDDLSIPSSTPLLVTATFTATSAGPFTINFGTTGAFPTDLVDFNGNNIAFTQVGATIFTASVPEPSTLSMLLLSLSFCVGLFVLRGTRGLRTENSSV